MHHRQGQFETIFQSTKEFLYGYIRKFVDSDADAKDILQQCYIRLWVNMENIDDSDNTLPLLYTYSKHLIVDAARKRASEKRNMLGYTYFMGEAVDSLTLPGDAGALRKLKQALLQIPERKRIIFLLRKEQGFSTQEIADRLQITPRAVRKHLEEAIALLKIYLSSAELFALLLLNAGSISYVAYNMDGML